MSVYVSSAILKNNIRDVEVIQSPQCFYHSAIGFCEAQLFLQVEQRKRKIIFLVA